jgi:biopolymer transport protein ExbD
MAEILSANKTNTGTIKRKLHSTRVDLTPMVDLGFLLITFFIFTTSLTEPKALNFIVPANGDSTQTGEKKTLNLILQRDDKVHYYVGNEVGKQGCTDFSTDGVRKIIREMKASVLAQFGDAGDMVVLIRPTPESSYKNLVDILDEMMIMNVKKYALMDEPADQILTPSNLKDPC